MAFLTLLLTLNHTCVYYIVRLPFGNKAVNCMLVWNLVQWYDLKWVLLPCLCLMSLIVQIITLSVTIKKNIVQEIDLHKYYRCQIQLLKKNCLNISIWFLLFVLNQNDFQLSLRCCHYVDYRLFDFNTFSRNNKKKKIPIDDQKYKVENKVQSVKITFGKC